MAFECVFPFFLSYLSIPFTPFHSTFFAKLIFLLRLDKFISLAAYSSCSLLYHISWPSGNPRNCTDCCHDTSNPRRKSCNYHRGFKGYFLPAVYSHTFVTDFTNRNWGSNRSKSGFQRLFSSAQLLFTKIIRTMRIPCERAGKGILDTMYWSQSRHGIDIRAS